MFPGGATHDRDLPTRRRVLRVRCRSTSSMQIGTSRPTATEVARISRASTAVIASWYGPVPEAGHVSSSVWPETVATVLMPKATRGME